MDPSSGLQSRAPSIMNSPTLARVERARLRLEAQTLNNNENLSLERLILDPKVSQLTNNRIPFSVLFASFHFISFFFYLNICAFLCLARYSIYLTGKISKINSYNTYFAHSVADSLFLSKHLCSIYGQGFENRNNHNFVFPR